MTTVRNVRRQIICMLLTTAQNAFLITMHIMETVEVARLLSTTLVISGYYLNSVSVKRSEIDIISEVAVMLSVVNVNLPFSCVL